MAGAICREPRRARSLSLRGERTVFMASTQPYVVDTRRSPGAQLHPVALSAVRLTDAFWEPRRETNRAVTIPSQYDLCEKTGRLDNFRRADGKPEIPYRGEFFNDSDVYKWLEAASSALADPALSNRAQIETQVETVIALIEGAVCANGYLNTYFMHEREAERYTNLRVMHELYCMGHFLQAAIAHHRATGPSRLLKIACRVADHLDKTFGKAAHGKREGVCGHEEIELALVELFRATGEPRYRALAEYFVNARGQTPSACYHANHGDDFDRRYLQDHLPYRELNDVTGHAVRMLYLAVAATDLLLEGADADLHVAVQKQWQNMTERRSYISGGIGSRWEGEAFGEDYELPPGRAYTETCAAIGSVMWNYRLLLLTGEARYADLLEHTLYNAVLPGLSLSGDRYFYQNPLENDGSHRRQEWFGTACCPPNVARLLAQLPGYFYATTDTGAVYAHLYAQGTASVDLPNGDTAVLETVTDYPWNGDVAITLRSDTKPFTLHLRVPEWATGATVTHGGETRPVSPGFAAVYLPGDTGETVRLRLPMPVRYMVSHPHVSDTAGRVAVLRGSLLYCAEAADNAGLDLRNMEIAPEAAGFAPVPHPELSGVTALRGAVTIASEPDNELYRPWSASAAQASSEKGEAVLLPYYLWANCEPGAMRVWLRERRA